MSKINSPIRFRKLVKGYSSIKKIKGTDDVYTVLTDSAQKNAQVLDSAKEVITEITDVPTRAMLITRLEQGFKSLGVTFPNLITKDVPFIPSVVPYINLLTFSRPPTAGSFKIRRNGLSNTTPLISYNESAASIQTKCRAIVTMVDVVVTGSIASGLTFTFPDASVSTVPIVITTNTLESSNPSRQNVQAPVDLNSCTGSFGITYESVETDLILVSDSQEQIQAKISAVITGSTSTYNGSSQILITFPGAATGLVTITNNTILDDTAQPVVLSVSDIPVIASVSTL